MITAEELRALVHYEPETGEFTYAVTKGRLIIAGRRAGSLEKSGYYRLVIDGKVYRGHRLAHLWMTGEWPPADIDHINLVKSDNRWSNLRRATRQQNKANIGPISTNTSGFKGVVRTPRGKPWAARINVKGSVFHLGCFATREEAHAAYVAAARQHFGEFARGA